MEPVFFDPVYFTPFGNVEIEPLSLPATRAYALLGWLGFPPEILVCLSAREVRARCMRRLWREKRNEGPLRRDVERLLELAEGAEDDMLLVG